MSCTVNSVATAASGYNVISIGMQKTSLGVLTSSEAFILACACSADSGNGGKFGSSMIALPKEHEDMCKSPKSDLTYKARSKGTRNTCR